MKRERKKSDTSARDSALRFISYRARTESEIRKKLTLSGFEADEIEKTIQWLSEIDLLDDLKFSRDLVSSRIRNKSWGKRKIAFDLKKFGVPVAICDQVLSEIDEDEELEAAETAFKAWVRKRGLSLPLERKDTTRAIKHLESRGFSISKSIKIVKGIITDNDLS